MTCTVYVLCIISRSLFSYRRVVLSVSQRTTRVLSLHLFPLALVFTHYKWLTPYISQYIDISSWLVCKLEIYLLKNHNLVLELPLLTPTQSLTPPWLKKKRYWWLRTKLLDLWNFLDLSTSPKFLVLMK